MIYPLSEWRPASTFAVILALGTAALTTPSAHGDGDNNTLVPNNKRLNDGVVANVYTAQRQAGCNHDVNSNPQLQRAAERHVDDLMSNRNLNGDIGSDGSTAQARANAAGYNGAVNETVAINPALAISGMEVLKQWYGNPAYKAIMSDCRYSQMGVWSRNSVDRTVLVAVYGQPPLPPSSLPSPDSPPPVNLASGQPSGTDPSPDYDASDELEKLMDWFPWALRGRSPTPGYPPN